MRAIVDAIGGEYERYRRLGAAVIDQLDDDQLCSAPGPESNSVATIVWHVSGNLRSRFTDFLTTDGEKPWRTREEEFARRSVSGEEVRTEWDRGWEVLFTALGGLDDGDLARTVTIRGVELSVVRALQRSLAHTAYHVGQMVFAGKALKGEGWTYLSIPPGGTAAYNRRPTRETVARPDQDGSTTR
jgi:hypothetical protein